MGAIELDAKIYGNLRDFQKEMHEVWVGFIPWHILGDRPSRDPLANP